MNIFVTKLDFNTDEGTLHEVFSAFGEVDSAKVIMDKFSGRSKGFGFVEMPNDEEAQAAINELNESELDGRTIIVKKAEPRENNNRRGGGGGYNKGGNSGSGNRNYNSRY